MSLQERLERLLADERTRKAAARVGRAWQESGDDEGLSRDLDAIEEHLKSLVDAVEGAKRDQAEAEAKKQALADEASERLKALADMRVPSEALSEVLEDIEAERYEQAFRRVDEIKATLEEIRRGTAGPPMEWRGPWNPEVEYEPGHTVRDEGISFVCLTKTLDRPSIDQLTPWTPLVDPRRLAAYVPVAGGGGSGGGTGPQGPAGPQNLFVQPTDPGMTSPGLWIETTAVGGDVLSFWIETG